MSACTVPNARTEKWPAGSSVPSPEALGDSGNQPVCSRYAALKAHMQTEKQRLKLVEVYLLLDCFVGVPRNQDGMGLIVFLNKDPILGIPNVFDQIRGVRAKFSNGGYGIYTFSVIHLKRLNFTHGRGQQTPQK